MVRVAILGPKADVWSRSGLEREPFMETPWYLHRSSHGWQGVAIFLIALHFVLPFAILLTRKVKRTPRLLAIVAAWLLLHVGWDDVAHVMSQAPAGHSPGTLPAF